MVNLFSRLGLFTSFLYFNRVFSVDLVEFIISWENDRIIGVGLNEVELLMIGKCKVVESLERDEEVMMLICRGKKGIKKLKKEEVESKLSGCLKCVLCLVK